MTTKRTPLALNTALLAAVESGDEGDRVRTLRRWLKEPSSAWPPALRDAVDGAGVGVAYLTRASCRSTASRPTFATPSRPADAPRVDEDRSSHVAESLADTGAKLEAYVVAVDAATSEDGHLLLTRVPNGV